MSRFAFFAFGVLTRRAIARTFEMHVAFSARSAFTKNKLLSISGKIDNRFIFDFGFWTFDLSRWINDRSNGNLDDLVRRGSAVHFLSHSVPAAFCLDEWFVKKV